MAVPLNLKGSAVVQKSVESFRVYVRDVDVHCAIPGDAYRSPYAIAIRRTLLHRNLSTWPFVATHENCNLEAWCHPSDAIPFSVVEKYKPSMRKWLDEFDETERMEPFYFELVRDHSSPAAAK
jgi:hypothetical protein